MSACFFSPSVGFFQPQRSAMHNWGGIPAKLRVEFEELFVSCGITSLYRAVRAQLFPAESEDFMKASVSTRLRRTAAIVAATGSFCLIGEAAAAPPISFPGGSCTLARITITPAGGLAIECETGAGVTPSITLAAPSTMTVNTVANFSINRSGDNGSANVAWAAAGNAPGCIGGTTLTFTAGVNSLPFSLTPTGVGSCTVALNMTAGTAGALGSPSQATYTVAAAGSAPPPPPPAPSGPAPGCPAVPTDLVEGELIWAGGKRIAMASGKIFSTLLPSTYSISGVVRLGETTISPQSAQAIEMSISKCKGEIKTDGGSCYSKSQGSANEVYWAQTSVPGISDAEGQAMGLCYAKLAEGPWYFSLRYTYSRCDHGTCGYVVQWNSGPF